MINGSREKILSKISGLREGLRPEDSLLIYYAGHGTYDRDLNMGFWQPVDAKPDQDFTWIDTNRLSKRLSTFTSRNILVVADSCFSGAVFRGADAEFNYVAGGARAYQSLIDKRTRLALTSGGMEPVLDSLGEGEN